jgi:hypothetical protein
MQGPKCNALSMSEEGTEDSGHNGGDEGNATRILRRCLQKAFRIENEVPDTTSEFQVIELAFCIPFYQRSNNSSGKFSLSTAYLKYHLRIF